MKQVASMPLWWILIDNQLNRKVEQGLQFDCTDLVDKIREETCFHVILGRNRNVDE